MHTLACVLCVCRYPPNVLNPPPPFQLLKTHTLSPNPPSLPPPTHIPHSEPERVPPDYQAMRANLSPLGKVIAGSCEVGVTTGMSYVSSGMLGYFGMGVWQLKSIGELGMKGIHAKAVTSGKSWGEVRRRLYNETNYNCDRNLPQSVSNKLTMNTNPAHHTTPHHSLVHTLVASAAPPK